MKSIFKGTYFYNLHRGGKFFVRLNGQAIDAKSVLHEFTEIIHESAGYPGVSYSSSLDLKFDDSYSPIALLKPCKW